MQKETGPKNKNANEPESLEEQAIGARRIEIPAVLVILGIVLAIAGFVVVALGILLGITFFFGSFYILGGFGMLGIGIISIWLAWHKLA